MISPIRLLLITDRDVCPDLTAGITSAIRGGGRHILLREKGLTGAPLLTLAEALRRLTRQQGAQLLIHDRVDVALAVEAEGVHLPESGLPTHIARKLLGKEKIVGRSCHDLEGACHALVEGADYVTLSPLFPTHSHPHATPLGITEFTQLRTQIPGPVLALGGITPENAAQVPATGADGVALIRGVLDAPDPGKAAREILGCLDGSK
ncbi:MAG: thiamine phosphate synthase [Magnetococcales bacterium]|nr:thiamine phosphate synthase [Magnetococcales bacterium]